MKQKVLFFAILLTVFTIPKSVKAYSFSAVAPSGQTLFYNIVDGHAEVVRPDGSTGSINYVSGNLVIPDSVTYNGFTYAVTAISSHYISPTSNTEMGAFYACEGLESVIIPNTVTLIGSSSFSHCSNLTTVTIGASVSSIGIRAFENCIRIMEINCLPTVAPYLEEEILDYTYYAFYGIPATIVINIPCGSLVSYSSRWSHFSNFIEDAGFTFNTQSNNDTMGAVSILTETTCQSQTTIFTAIANNGYKFSHWSDNNTDNPRILTLTQDTSITAFFEPNAVLYNVVMNNALGGGTYPLGSTATVFALPQVNLQFAGWSDGETVNPRSVVVTRDTTLTAIYRTPDTVRIYDTTTIYDTVINIVYDTTEYNHYYYDTTRVFDTLIVYDTTWAFDTLIVYDTTRVYDTLVYVNIDTLNHYYFDTTRIFDTLEVFDTTRIFDTLIYVNIDTLNHYYFDTTRMFDTMVYVNIDTLHHYYYDTARVFDTMVYVNIDTLNHYYFDTTRVFDTVFNLDTVHHYFYDTTLVYDTVIQLHLDTLHYYHYDTTHTVNTLVFYDTTSVTHYVFDSIFLFDTVYIHDTIYIPHEGIDGTETIDAKIYQHDGQIVVESDGLRPVRVFDATGRVLAQTPSPLRGTPPSLGGELGWRSTFEVPASGVYLVKIGDLPARKVVVIR